jgi:hypothetical protein
MKKIVAGISLMALLLTGCSSPEAEPAPSLSSLTWLELQANEEFVQWLDGYCQHENYDNLVEDFEFLTLGPGENAFSLRDVMSNRTERIEKALGKQTDELAILAEYATWDDKTAEYPQAWSSPSQVLNGALSAGFEQSVKFLGDGTSFNSEVQENIKSTWLESCGYSDKLNLALETISPYEDALGKVSAAAIKRLVSQGYKDFGGVILYKLKVKLTGASNRFEVETIQYSPCSSEDTSVNSMDFSIPGKEGADGISNAEITVTAFRDLDDERNSVSASTLWSEGFYVYENDFEPVAATKQNDFNSSRLEDVSCSF